MIDPDHHDPADMQEAITLLYDNLTDDERKAIRGCLNGAPFHHGIGRDIREFWLWEPGNKLMAHAKIWNGLGDPDDVTSIILDGVVAKVNGEPFDLQSEVDKHRQYWLNKGYDPSNLYPTTIKKATHP